MAAAAIGLDIGTSSVRAAQVSMVKGQARLDAIGQVALPESVVHDGEVVDRPAVVAAINQLWKHSRLSGKKVCLGVASSRVIVRQVDLPWMAAGELKASLNFAVEEMLPVPVDQVYLDFCQLEDVQVEGERKARGLLVAAPKELIRANVAAVEAAGLKPAAVDLAPLAVLRSAAMTGLGASFASGSGWELDEDPMAAVTAMVEIGASVTSVIIHERGVPRFVRIIGQGGSSVTNAVAERLGVDAGYAEAIKQEFSTLGYVTGLSDGVGEKADPAVVERAIETCLSALITEIRGSLEFFSASSSVAVQRVVLSGGGSRLRGLAQKLAAGLELPVTTASVLEGMSMGNTGLSHEQLDFLNPLCAVPVGLALGALS